MALNLNCLRVDTYTVSSPFGKQGPVPTTKDGEFFLIDHVALHKPAEGCAISVPGLSGCWSQSATELEAIANIQDAIREYLAAVDNETRGQDVRGIELPWWPVNEADKFLLTGGGACGMIHRAAGPDSDDRG